MSSSPEMLLVLNSKTNPRHPQAAKWCLGGPLQSKGLPKKCLTVKGYTGFIAESNNYNNSGDNDMSLPSLFHRVP